MATDPPFIHTPDQRLRVFVSSTIQELERERTAATSAIRSLKLTPVLFELGARPYAPRQLYRAYLEQSHVFVGIYGERYGWIAPGMGISGLEDEYRLCGEQPKLIYVRDPAPGREARLGAMIRRMAERDQVSYKTFSSPEELESMLADDLAVLLSERFASARAASSGAPRPLAGARALWSSRTRRLGVGAGLAAVAILLAVAGLLRRAPPPGAGAADDAPTILSPGPPEPTSIAVLPFVDLSPEADQEYFSDGLSEELVNVLAKVPQLRVISRTSSFQFKGRNEDVRSIARRLNVANVLEGSVRKSGSHLRITAQLIDAATGSHRWSETYDRELDDIFQVQEEIAGEVVQILHVILVDGALPRRTPPRDTEAYTLVLKGRHFSDRHTRADSDRAVATLERALELDPEYAVAWAELARAHVSRAGSGFAPRGEAIAAARRAAERAVALDPDLASGHALLGLIEGSYDWNWQAADSRFRRALELDSGSAGLLANAGMLSRALGRIDESIDLIRRGLERDPLQALLHMNLAISLLYAGRLDEAEAACRQALELRPDAVGQKYLLGRILLAKGELEAARRAIESEPDEGWRMMGLALVDFALGRDSESAAALAALIERLPDDMPFQIAEVLAYRGEVDRAFEWLERARALHDTGFLELKGDPLLASLESDPRYRSLLEKLGLPAPSGRPRVEPPSSGS